MWSLIYKCIARTVSVHISLTTDNTEGHAAGVSFFLVLVGSRTGHVKEVSSFSCFMCYGMDVHSSMVHNVYIRGVRSWFITVSSLDFP